MADILLPFSGQALHSHEVRIVGVGSAGLACIDRLAEEWGNGPELIGVDCDESVLNQSLAHEKLWLNHSVLNGMGTGRNLQAGKEVVAENLPKLSALVQDSKVMILIGGLGGGTAGAVLPALCRMAEEESAVVICLVSLPFRFEDREAKQAAREGLVGLKEYAHLLFCYPHERLQDFAGDVSLAESFELAARHLGQGVQALWNILARPGLINLDYHSLITVCLKTGGGGSLASVTARGDQCEDDLVKQIAEHAYLERGHTLAGAQAVLAVITGGPSLSITNIENIMERVKSLLQPSAALHVGVTVDPSWKDERSLTVIVAEHWDAAVEPPEGGDPDADQQLTIDLPGAETGKGRKKMNIEQTEIDLAPQGKGRFRDVEPTFYNGEDLDIPTFRRRNIQLSEKY